MLWLLHRIDSCCFKETICLPRLADMTNKKMDPVALIRKEIESLEQKLEKLRDRLMSDAHKAMDKAKAQAERAREKLKAEQDKLGELQKKAKANMDARVQKQVDRAHSAVKSAKDLELDAKALMIMAKEQIADLKGDYQRAKALAKAAQEAAKNFDKSNKPVIKKAAVKKAAAKKAPKKAASPKKAPAAKKAPAKAAAKKAPAKKAAVKKSAPKKAPVANS
jgi:chromosome segregation ATPase